ncbi:hypothetical protein EC960109_2995B, partial [Escherichia coli 96.0109]
LFSRKFPA